MEEDAVVGELVDVVAAEVRIMAEDLMALKMRLLVVDAVVRLIEEDMDINMDVGVGVGVGIGMVELATLIGRLLCGSLSQKEAFRILTVELKA